MCCPVAVVSLKALQNHKKHCRLAWTKDSSLALFDMFLIRLARAAVDMYLTLHSERISINVLAGVFGESEHEMLGAVLSGLV